MLFEQNKMRAKLIKINSKKIIRLLALGTSIMNQVFRNSPVVLINYEY